MGDIVLANQCCHIWGTLYRSIWNRCWIPTFSLATVRLPTELTLCVNSVKRGHWLNITKWHHVWADQKHPLWCPSPGDGVLTDPLSKANQILFPVFILPQSSSLQIARWWQLNTEAAETGSLLPWSGVPCLTRLKESLKFVIPFSSNTLFFFLVHDLCLCNVLKYFSRRRAFSCLCTRPSIYDLLVSIYSMLGLVGAIAHQTLWVYWCS